MIGNILGYHAVGIYSPSAIIFQSILALSGIITATMYPLLLRKKKEGNQKNYSKFSQTYFDFYALFGFVFFVILFFSSSMIIKLLFGNDFINSIIILQIFSVTLIFTFYLDGLTKWLITESLYKILFFLNFCGCILNIVLNYYFIHLYGIVGAALATSISMIITVLILPLFFQRSMKSTIHMLLSFLFILRLNNIINLFKDIKYINEFNK